MSRCRTNPISPFICNNSCNGWLRRTRSRGAHLRLLPSALRQKYLTFCFFAIASARKKVILWMIVPRQQEALIMFDGQKLSANDEEDMEDFQDYDDEEHPDETSKLDDFDEEDEEDEEEEILVIAAVELPPAAAPAGPPDASAAAAPKKPAKKATQAAAKKPPTPKAAV